MNRWRALELIPARTVESDTLSRDLSHRGFKFVGSTICYAFMQAVGLVNDHTTDCFRYPIVGQMGRGPLCNAAVHPRRPREARTGDANGHSRSSAG